MALTDQSSLRTAESVSRQRPKVQISLGGEDVVARKRRSIYVLLAFGIPFLSAIIFSLIANHAWEDWYITYRSSKNLATGYGLVYDPTQKVHSFTSPLGTLLPAAIKFFIDASDDGVLWWFRILQACLLGFSGLLLLGVARELRLSNWTYALLLGLFSLDAKIIDFSTNGMETGFLVFFIVLTTYGLVVPFRKPGLVLGVAWAGLMWTRPDGFIYIVALSLGFFVFPRATIFGSNRWILIRTFSLASVITAFLYLPWLIWAWTYYGSFVPNSLTAKGVGIAPIQVVKTILTFPVTGLTRISALDDIFRPAYASVGGWPPILADVSRIISWLCSFAWVLAFLRPVTRAMSLATLVAELYLSRVTPGAAPWYIPGTTVLVIVVISLLFEEIVIGRIILYQSRPTASIYVNRLRLARYVPILAIVPIFTTLVLTICVAYQFRVQQHIIEEKNRKQIGLWLHDHASSSQDRVFLEPLGYIGFYSNLRMYGFPGQSSPELVAARRKLSCMGGIECYAALISFLKPEWLVLRPVEADRVRKDDSTLLTTAYTLEKTFDVSSELASFTFLPGRGLLQIDQTFLVYKRNKSNGLAGG
jgi:hypothetical protein